MIQWVMKIGRFAMNSPATSCLILFLSLWSKRSVWKPLSLTPRLGRHLTTSPRWLSKHHLQRGLNEENSLECFMAMVLKGCSLWLPMDKSKMEAQNMLVFKELSHSTQRWKIDGVQEDSCNRKDNGFEVKGIRIKSQLCYLLSAWCLLDKSLKLSVTQFPQV